MKRGGRRSAGSGAHITAPGRLTQPPASLEQLADKAYDSDALRATIAATAVIPSQQDHHSPRCHSLGTAIALSTALIVSSTSGNSQHARPFTSPASPIAPLRSSGSVECRSDVARISHRVRRIGAPNQRKFFCEKDFGMIRGAPRCRQSVAQNNSILESLEAGLWRRPSMPGWFFSGCERPSDLSGGSICGLFSRPPPPGFGGARGEHSDRPAGVRDCAGLLVKSYLGCPPLYSPAPPPAGRSRHAAVFSRQPAFGPSGGADARTRRLHQEATKSTPQHRIARRSQAPARATLTPDPTCQNHCAEVFDLRFRYRLRPARSSHPFETWNRVFFGEPSGFLLPEF